MQPARQHVLHDAANEFLLLGRELFAKMRNVRVFETADVALGDVHDGCARFIDCVGTAARGQAT